MDMFDLFTNTNYTFLVIEQGVDGNTIKSEHSASGIVKLREGMQQTGYSEVMGQGVLQSTPSLKIKPTEAFLDLVGKNTIGHGIRVSKDGSEPVEYRIQSQVEGFDFDTNELVFYKVTLKREAIATWQEPDLPLS